ncbi:MAG: LolA-related protein [Wenzhouxiangella sp.]
MISQTAVNDPATPELDALDLHALIAQLAIPAEQELSFTETRQSGLLTAPLEVRGLLHRDVNGRLIRETHAPRRETQILAADYVEIRNERGHRQRFSLHRAPELGALRQALNAILEGDPETLLEHFHSELNDHGDRWTLSLQPRAEGLSSRVVSLELEGSGHLLQGLQMTLDDGEVIQTRFDSAP